ncbi:hypothetical protein V6Z12_D02G240600 [Gossypium hirsutum]
MSNRFNGKVLSSLEAKPSGRFYLRILLCIHSPVANFICKILLCIYSPIPVYLQTSGG